MSRTRIKQKQLDTDGWIPDYNTWSYSSGIRTQAYTNDPAAGSSITLNVANTSGFIVGDSVTVSSSAGSEIARIISIVTNTSITVNSLALNHTTSSPLITLNETTYVISINADVTGLITVGNRIKLTQTGTKYFIVTNVGAYSGGATLITVFGGTDYTLANADIDNPFYSYSKGPFGFPTSSDKWTVLVADTTNAAQATPTASTWYNMGSIAISIPIGAWDIFYHCINELTITTAAVQTYAMRCTLSTANNSESNSSLTSSQGGTLPILVGALARFIQVRNKYPLTLSSKTTYYLNSFWGAGTATSLNFRGDLAPTRIQAVCSYL